jgi:hypothetical protein
MNDITRKTRSDSTIDSLAPEVRDQIEAWLFEDNLSLTDIVQKLQEQHQTKSSIAALSRYAKRRRLARLFETSEDLCDVAPVDPQVAKRAGEAFLHAAIAKSLNLVSEDNCDSKELGRLVRLVSTAKEMEFRQRRVELAEAKHRLKSGTEMLKTWPKNSYSLVDTNTEPGFLRRTRLKIFGEHLASDEGWLEATQAETEEIIRKVQEQKNGPVVPPVTPRRGCALGRGLSAMLRENLGMPEQTPPTPASDANAT